MSLPSLQPNPPPFLNLELLIYIVIKPYLTRVIHHITYTLLSYHNASNKKILHFDTLFHFKINKLLHYITWLLLVARLVQPLMENHFPIILNFCTF